MRKRLCAVLSLVALLGAACGGDEKTSTGTTDTTETTGTTETGSDTAAIATYCADALAIETVGQPDIDFDASEAEQKEAVKKFANEEIKPLAERLKKSVPAEIDEPAQVLFAATDKIAADGDFEKHFETPEVKAAEAKLHTYDLANCGWEKTDVTATEYAFAGIPATLEAGVNSFEFKNSGKELHELLVLKKKDGVTESFDEILKLDEAEVEKKVDPVASGFAAQGEGDYAVAELEAGEYVVVCFIPVGTTGQGPPPEDAPPHVSQGMKAEFKVA